MTSNRYYLGGVTEGTETILAFVLMAMLPRWFEPLAYGFGALCWLSTAGRIWQGATAFREAKRPGHSTG